MDAPPPPAQAGMEGVKKGTAPFSETLLFLRLDFDQLRRIATIELAHVLAGEIPTVPASPSTTPPTTPTASTSKPPPPAPDRRGGWAAGQTIFRFAPGKNRVVPVGLPLP